MSRINTDPRTFFGIGGTTFQAVAEPGLLASGSGSPPAPRRTSPSIDRMRQEAVARTELQAALLDPARLNASMPIIAWTKDYLRSLGREVSSDPRELLASGGGGISGYDAIDLLVRNIIVRGFRNVRDTTLGWVERGELPNYLQADVHVVNQPVQMQAIGCGESAASLSYGVSAAASWKLAKYAHAFVVDEQDVVNGMTIGVLQLTLAESGAAAARVLPDLIYATLLANGNLPDGSPLFDSSRGNIRTGGGSALGSTGLATAYGDLAGQTLTPARPGGVVHIGLQPKYLLVPPPLATTALGLAHDLSTGSDDDIIVRVESRLGPAGVINPLSDEAVVGTSTNWMLAAPSEQAPTILAAALDGKFEPTIRSGPLKRGEWGTWYDISLSVGVCAVDSRGLHFNAGA